MPRAAHVELGHHSEVVPIKRDSISSVGTASPTAAYIWVGIGPGLSEVE